VRFCNENNFPNPQGTRDITYWGLPGHIRATVTSTYASACATESLVRGESKGINNIKLINNWTTVTGVAGISNTSPPVTVMPPLLYRVHKTFRSKSLQPHMRSENQIFDDRLEKFNSDWPPPLSE
jgi:hypothetical protein